MPVNMEINHQFQRNPHIDNIRERYLIKVKKDLNHEFYIINKITDISDDSQDIKQVHCYSLQYELTDKLIRSYEVVSYNAQQVLNDALSQTLWGIEYIEPEFLSTYRSFSVSSKTVLEFLNEIATTFSALIIYNTLQRTISLYNPDNIGQNKGLRFSYGNLIKAIEQTINTDNFATRLKVYGQDNLTIQEVNPTNENFIENYSNFMTADFMSESLINAITNYTALIEVNKDNYATLLSQLTFQQELLTTKSNELTDLKTELLIIEDSLSIAIETDQSTIAELTIQRDAKQDEVDAKQLEIDAVNLEITNITNQMIVVRDLLSTENNFTSEQIIERNQFIIEKELTNSNYTSSQDLYDFALKEFDKICKPEISIKIEIAYLLEILEQQHNWDKLNLSDICTIYYPRLNISIQAKIIEIDFDYEEGSVVLTIANVQQILTDQQKFLKNLYNAISTSTSMDMSKYKFQNAFTKATEIEEIINNTWNAVTRSIVAGINESVKIDSKGITVVSPDDPMGVVRINHANIAVSADGGNTFKNALTKSGLVAERIFGLLGEFCQLRADQIILGDSGETIPDDIISSSSNWNATSSQLTDFITNTYPTDISQIQSNIQTQIDGKADTFYQTSMPHQEYTNVPDNVEYNKFISDLWYNSTSTVKKTYIYTKTINGSNFDYKWSQQEIPQDIFDTIDGKKTIYTLQPSSYQINDIWILESDIVHSPNKQGEILTANATNTTYLSNDWVVKVRYTDDTIANQALTDAYNAQISADTANDDIAEMASDAKLTPVEKQNIKLQWDAIVAEKPILDTQATTYGVTTEKTTYDNAYDTLNTYITPLLTDLTITSDIIGNTFRTNFSNYYTSKVNLLNKIADITKATVDNLQIGGRNLLKESQTSIVGVNNWETANPLAGTTQTLLVDGVNTVVITCDVSGWLYENTKHLQLFLTQNLLLNQPYVLSLDVKTSKVYSGGLTLNTSYPFDSFTFDIPNTNGKWVRIGLNFKLTGTYSYVRFTITMTNAVIGDTISFRNIKLELGNKFTDWAPAPEDTVQTNINYNSTYITQNGVQVKNSSSLDVVNMGEFATGLYGIRASHSDGSYTQLTADGLQRLVVIDGISENKPYQYETYIKSGSTIGLGDGWIGDDEYTSEEELIQKNIWYNGISLELPIRFKNKNFNCSLSLTKLNIPLVETGNDSVMNFFVESIDYVNAIVDVVAYTESIEYGSYGGTFFRGLEFLLIVTI